MSGGIFEYWPNRITAIRFVGSIVLFAILSIWGDPNAALPGAVAPPMWLAQLAFWLFIVVAITDVIDGYLARRDNQVTAFGRIADPFVDKVLVLGVMIYLAVMSWSQVWFPAWIVVTVLAREFLVTGIRGYVESLGKEFPADRFGKIKMIVQCFAIGTVLGFHAFPTSGLFREIVYWSAHVLVWATLVATIGSGFNYVMKTKRLLGESGT